MRTMVAGAWLVDPLSRIEAEWDLRGKGISFHLERLHKHRLEDPGDRKRVVLSACPWGAGLVYHSQSGEQGDACSLCGPEDWKQAA